MPKYPEFSTLDLEQLILRFIGVPPDEADEDNYYDELAITIRLKGEVGIEALLGLLKKVSRVSQKRGAIMGLTFPPQLKKTVVEETLIGLLDADEPLIVADAISGLIDTESKNFLNRILPFQSHPSPYVRGSVLRFLSALYPNKAYPILIEALGDLDYIVRENAADELGEMKLDDSQKTEAIAHLRNLLEDSHPHVRQAVETAIKMIEGILI
ncbi:MAG: HEAT repeat domain-containing protein [Anaerolineae bacterium]|nr:HEAT repeat domain-containing protein [Anaerolineae bacterium]